MRTCSLRRLVVSEADEAHRQTAIFAQGVGLGASKGTEVGKYAEGYTGYVQKVQDAVGLIHGLMALPFIQCSLTVIFLFDLGKGAIQPISGAVAWVFVEITMLSSCFLLTLLRQKIIVYSKQPFALAEEEPKVHAMNEHYIRECEIHNSG